MSFRSIVLAVAASALLPAAAQAATAFASTAVHVRAGPGTGNPIVDTLHAGERVRVDQCTRSYSWCHVSHRGADGWVAARFLNDRRNGTRRPLDRFGFRLNIPQFNLHVGVGPNGAYAGQSRANRRADNKRRGNANRRQAARVCFYENYGYGGRHFCAHPGQSDSALGKRWNDTISSIRVSGGASVQVCQNFNYGGRCHVVNHDMARIGGRNNDVISSYRVYGPGQARNGNNGRGRNGNGRGRRVARVCFYENFNYGGRSFCANEGHADRSLGKRWNDRISSIRVMGNARVRVCENFDYGGRCRVVTRDRPRLNGRNNDVISSYRVM